MFDACNTLGFPTNMDSGTLYNAFFPTFGPNQAFIGANHETLICSENQQWTARLWQALGQGYTVSGAVKKASSGGRYPQGYTVQDSPTTVGNLIILPRGDGRTKLHGVYGSPEGSTAWYR